MYPIHRHPALLLAGLALVSAPLLGQAANRAKQTPPIQMGTSGGGISDSSSGFCCAGTLGALIRYDGQIHILSNNHVLARSGLATSGEDTIQPGLIDSNCSSASSNRVADFVGNLIPLGTRNVDVGIALARAGQVNTTGSIIGIGTPCAATQTATVGLSVRKSGRTTGLTTGTVQATNVSANVGYQRGCGVGQQFAVSYTGQITITPGTFSAGGDSGSLIVSNDGTPNPVGLLFAGSSAVTIANPVGSVVSALATGGHTVSFVGAACKSAAADEAKALGVPAAEVELAKSVQARYEKDLFTLPGVIGVGVGKTEDKADVSTPALIVYVEGKPGMRVQGFPSEMDGVKVRVVPTSPFVAY